MQALAREHSGLLLTGALFLYTGLKLSALAQGNLAVALVLAQTVGTGEILLAAVTQLSAQTAWPVLLSLSLLAAFAGVARPIAIAAAIGSLYFGYVAAPWWLFLMTLVVGLILGWVELRPGGRAKRASAWSERDLARPTAVALAMTLFAFMAATLPVKAAEHVTLEDGAVLAGEVYGADEGFVVILVREGDLRFVPRDDIVRRELCRRPADVQWQSVVARFRPQLEPCRSRVADPKASRDAAFPDDNAPGESPRD